MALSDDQILDLAATTQLYNHALPAIRFARAIEAEVRKQDEALIQQMLGALTDLVDTGEEAWGKDRPCVRIGKEEINAARARLGEGNGL